MGDADEVGSRLRLCRAILASHYLKNYNRLSRTKDRGKKKKELGKERVKQVVKVV